MVCRLTGATFHQPPPCRPDLRLETRHDDRCRHELIRSGLTRTLKAGALVEIRVIGHAAPRRPLQGIEHLELHVELDRVADDHVILENQMRQQSLRLDW